MTENQVTFESGGGGTIVTVTREVWEQGDRILGSETTVMKRYCGYDGWKKWTKPTATKQFSDMLEGLAWIGDMQIAEDYADLFPPPTI